MENPALAQQLKVLLLCVVGLLFAALLGWNIGVENYYPLILGTSIIFVAGVTFLSGPYFWVLTVASASLAGTFPILQGQFTPFQILMAIGVCRFLIGDIVLKRARIRYGSRFHLLMICGFMAVLTLHAIHDRFGMRFLGSSIWGGRNYVNVYVGFAAFFVIQSIPMRPRVWAKLPYAILAVSAFDSAVAIITTVFPSTIYKIYPFYSAVSMAGVEELLGGTAVETPRLSAIGNFGVTIFLIVLASTSVRRILHPGNFGRLMALIVGTFAVLYSSFRSAVFGAVILTMVATIRDLKAGAVALLPFLAAFLFALSIINSEFVALPKQVQRSLAFMPGKWDADMARDAAASNDFRQKTWTLWLREFFPVHPLIGRGFGFRSEWTKTSIYAGRSVDYQQMVETGNLHNGFLAAIDSFGIVGTIFFAIWNLRILRDAFAVRAEKKSTSGIVVPFLALYLAVCIISYWFGAQTVGAFLPQEFVLVAVFLAVKREATERSQASETARPELVDRTGKRLVPA